MNRAAFQILLAKLRELSIRSPLQIKSDPGAAMDARVKRIASVPYFRLTSIGSTPVPLDFDILWPSGVRTIECR
jgi:hypothetical protein